jgi:hypothetical protein
VSAHKMNSIESAAIRDFVLGCDSDAKITGTVIAAALRPDFKLDATQCNKWLNTRWAGAVMDPEIQLVRDEHAKGVYYNTAGKGQKLFSGNGVPLPLQIAAKAAQFPEAVQRQLLDLMEGL